MKNSTIRNIVLVSILALFVATFSTRANQSMPAIAQSTHGILDGSNDMRTSDRYLPTYNTGECGYYRETGLIHRNLSDDYCTSDSEQVVTQSQPKNAPTTPQVVLTQDTSDSPVNPVSIVPVVIHDHVIVTHEKKPKCNNGEGNGSEGCSPANSTHANNDENKTTPKQDKSHKNK